ncbi:hypothetical protein [Propionispora hippei]|uniref:Uncharacterized protein n=1 Tax=Propionispora hippei DSM 15287 TaxID=1123003 RepID=A0A1M6G731_9FIRM|nr:hypothetical protein [Propionispora hippei]SHJ05798.1 hypothetical protein SAMN02745170_01651 [Propionispora hippei DSM 15287]
MRETVKKLLITTELPFDQLEILMRIHLANRASFSITWVKRVQATNFSYYCYVVVEDARREDDICAALELVCVEVLRATKCVWQPIT